MEQETEQEGNEKPNEEEAESVKQTEAPLMDFSMPEITIDQVFDSSLLPSM